MNMNFSQASDEFLNYLLIEKNYSENTLKGYAYDLQCYELFLTKYKRSMLMPDLNPSTSRRFIQDQVINHEVKPRTLQRRISCLKSLSKFCLKENFITEDFMAGVQAPKADSRLPVYMSLEELQKLFSWLEQDSRPLATRNNLMFKLLGTTGMRRQELVDLTWQQIDLSSKTILIKGKGKKERLLPLHSIVIPLFYQYRNNLSASQLHPNEPVFLNKNDKKLNPRGLHVIFKGILSKAGLPSKRFSLHHLRHTFATLLLQGQDDTNKVDLRTLQELLGHESLATTSVYTHVDLEQKRNAINSFKITN